MLRRHRWFLHLDVKAYFPSVRISTLRRLIAARVRDPRLLGVVDAVLEVGRGFYDEPGRRAHARMEAEWPLRGEGLPIGALTSQLFAAHVYLCAFDHFVKRRLRVPGYIRYVDDLLLFGPSRGRLLEWRDAMADWLWEKRTLRLKAPSARPRRCTGVLNALGRRIDRSRIEPLPRAWSAWRACVAKELLEAGRLRRGPELERAIPARVGHLMFP